MDNRLDWIKWRWEFLRRTEDYRINYQNYLEIRKSKPPKEDLEGYAHPIPYTVSDGYTHIERAFCYNTGINLNYLPDPKKSFEELISKEKNQGDTTERKKMIAIASNMFDWGAVKVEYPNTILGRSKVIFNIVIDFRKQNSIAALKTEVNNYIDKQHDIYLNLPHIKRKKQAYLIDYDVILQVGDMKEKSKLTNQEIAKRIDNRKYRDNPESATRNVSHLYKKYKELINGGFWNISPV
jgi:hypothetical protein